MTTKDHAKDDRHPVPRDVLGFNVFRYLSVSVPRENCPGKSSPAGVWGDFVVRLSRGSSSFCKTNCGSLASVRP